MSKKSLHRVLIISASVGAGHLRAASALENAFKLRSPGTEVLNIDILDYTNTVFRLLYSKLYLEMVSKAPHLLGLLYDRLDTPYRNEKLIHALNKLNTQPFLKFLKHYNPDLILCTHFLPSEIISRLKEKKELKCPQAIVVTDLDVAGMWFCRKYEHYFVALEETREIMKRFDVPAEKITVTGIPIDPIFSQPRDKSEMRVKHGLDRDKPTILISAGGFGVGPVEKLIVSLLDLTEPAQVIAVCGRNADLKKKMEALVKKRRSQVKMKVLGFSTEMDELMSASDILVGKPGGLTTAEALAKGLVLVIVNPIPGQEARNSDHFLEEGVGIRCNNLPVLAWKIDQLLKDHKRLSFMKQNVTRLARPNAAFDIIEKSVKLVQGH